MISEALLAAAEVPEFDSFVVWARHYDAVTELKARDAVRVVTQRHQPLTSC